MQDVDPASGQVVTHKEEMPARMTSDAKDREKIRKKLEACTDPINPEDHPLGIFNIISGRIRISHKLSMLTGLSCLGQSKCLITKPHGLRGFMVL